MADFSVTESAKARDNARLAGAARGCGVPASDRGGSGLWGPRKRPRGFGAQPRVSK